MPHNPNDDPWRRIFGQAQDSRDEVKASSRLKARVYSALIREQQRSGPLESLSDTQAREHGLCAFEKLVQIAPIGETAKTPFFCWVCHARILAETIDGAPIYWNHCPYAKFQKR
jgi:hypothetical protein